MTFLCDKHHLTDDSSSIRRKCSACTCVSLGVVWVSTIFSPTRGGGSLLLQEQLLLVTPPPQVHSHLQGTWGWRTSLSCHRRVPPSRRLQRKKTPEGHRRGHSGGQGPSAPQAPCQWEGSEQEGLTAQDQARREAPRTCSSTSLRLLSRRAS